MSSFSISDSSDDELEIADVFADVSDSDSDSDADSGSGSGSDSGDDDDDDEFDVPTFLR